MGVLIGGGRLPGYARLALLDEGAPALVRGRLVVERRLQVLERQREIEHADVALAEFGGRGALRCHRARGCKGADQGAAADHRTPGDASLPEEPEAGVAALEL